MSLSIRLLRAVVCGLVSSNLVASIKIAKGKKNPESPASSRHYSILHYFYVKWHLIGLCGPPDYACYYSSCLLPSFCIAPFLSVTFHFVLHYVLFNNMRYFFLYLYLKAISIYLGREFLKHCYLLQPRTILQARNHLEKRFYLH